MSGTKYKPSRTDQLFGFIFVGTQISLVSIVFAGIWMTPFEKFWRPTSVSTALLTAVMMWTYRLDERSVFRRLGMVMGYALALSVVIVSFGFGLVHVYQFIPIAPSSKVIFTIALGSLVLGLGCYLIRRSFRMTWGATEIVVGLLIVLYRTNNRSGSTSLMDVEYFIAFVTAGLYLMVRGFDNLEQGSKIKHEQRKARERSQREPQAYLRQAATRADSAQQQTEKAGLPDS